MLLKFQFLYTVPANLVPGNSMLDENGDLLVAGTYRVEEEVFDDIGGCGC
jgi:hypothetical protein